MRLNENILNAVISDTIGTGHMDDGLEMYDLRRLKRFVEKLAQKKSETDNKFGSKGVFVSNVELRSSESIKFYDLIIDFNIGRYPLTVEIIDSEDVGINYEDRNAVIWVKLSELKDLGISPERFIEKLECRVVGWDMYVIDDHLHICKPIHDGAITDVGNIIHGILCDGLLDEYVK